MLFWLVLNVKKYSLNIFFLNMENKEALENAFISQKAYACNE